MFIEELLKLPSYICFEGVEFTFELFIEADDECRLCYKITGHSQQSPHAHEIENSNSWLNPLLNQGPHKWDKSPYSCSFLYLVEGISNDEEMLEAIWQTKEFLTKHKLI